MKRIYLLLAALVTIATLAGSILVAPYLPQTVPIHWNIHGKVDGYGPRWEAALLMPLIMAAITVLTWLLPWLSPKRYEVNGPSPRYLQITIVVLVLMGYIQVILLSAAAGAALDAGKAILAGLALMLAALGPLLTRLPRNFYVGIRTPWALASVHVWEDTHRFAAKCFTIAGAAGLLLVLAGAGPWAAGVLVGIGALVPVIYSLVVYKQLERRGEL